MIHDTCSTSGTSGLHPICTKHQELNLKMYLCTYDQVYIVDVQYFRSSYTYYRSLHPYLYVSVYVRRVCKRVSIYMCHCVYTFVSRNSRGTSRGTGTRRNWMIAPDASSQRERAKTKHDHPMMSRCVAPARGRMPTVRVPQGDAGATAPRGRAGPPRSA